jgi:hypothetical protein
MDAQPAPDPDPKALLAATLRDPFADKSATHVRDWFRFLVEDFRLWTFQAPAYASLHKSDLPTAYPLRLMVRSILEDEGGVRLHRLLASLPATLDLRRSAIAEGNLDNVSWSLAESRKPEFSPEVVADLARWQPEAVPGFQPSPYEFLAREFVALVEDHVFAVEKSQRNRAKRVLNQFLDDMEANLASHRPHEGLPPAVLDALVNQGRALIELCWRIFPFEVSDQTRAMLATEGISETGMEAWAARLALPFLSQAEILALKAESEKAAKRKRGSGSYPTPRRFVIGVLAHRLGARATTLARKAFDSDTVVYFEKKPDPIKRQLSKLKAESHTHQ